MRAAPLACLMALAAAGGARAATGLVLSSAGLDSVRPHPHLFLAAGEGFTPRSASAEGRFEGLLSVERSGAYTFHVPAGTLSLGGELVNGEPLGLAAGLHAFDLRVPRGEGDLLVTVEWEGPGFYREPIPQRYFSHERGAPASTGRQQFEDLGCANCHSSGSASLRGRLGPDLTDAGGRLRPAWIHHWLEAPERFRSWATMPAMLDSQGRADVAAFLASLGRAPPEERRPRSSDSERGRTAFQSLGCVACHGSTLPLTGLGSKMTPGRLQSYLLDPLAHAPDGRMPSLHLSDDEAFDLAAYLALSRDDAFEVRPAPPGDAARGRQLVGESGCLACHRIDGLESSAKAPTLASLDPGTGCLSEAVPPGLPRYRLTPEDRLVLARFIRDHEGVPDSVPAPAFDLPRRLRQLGCNACHETDGVPPTGAVAESAPPLSGAGRKLRAAWLEHVLQSPSRNLDWQQLRMPSYGSAWAAWLADALPKAAGIDPREAGWSGSTGDRARGLQMLGVDGERGGMGCIGCHGWKQFPALGEDGPNLFDAGQRLRWPWFERWMRVPARILAGTSMPSYFSGPPTARSQAAIADLWAAFRAAGQLPPPPGFGGARELPGSEARPVPVDRAIVIRWDMPEATPSAFAVGLPGGISYCFDAGETRLRYAWRGGFVDMSRTLLAKKNRETNLTETAEVVGEVFFREGPAPVRVGNRNQIPQRRFRGYRMVGSVPEFHYELDGMEVRERILGTQGGLVRTFFIPRVDRPAWFLSTESEGVEIRSTLVGDRIPFGDSVRFEVTILAHP